MAEGPESYLYINICDSLRIVSVKGDYIAYGIRSIASDPHFSKLTFLTRRCYSDFDDLRQLLESRHMDVRVPDIPPRTTTENEFSENVIEIRMKGFQKFIDQVLATKQLKSDPALQLFIQSNKTMAQIRKEVASKEQQEALNSNRSTQETVTSQVIPGAHQITSQSSSDGAADTQDDCEEYIFEMDDLD